MSDDRKPFVVGLGGTTNPNSSTECALRIALQAAADDETDSADLLIRADLALYRAKAARRNGLAY